jgi:hypothetical protein
MPPNDRRALDRQVAIEVMGLDPDRGMGSGAVLPMFGTDVGAAWQVVDQMGRRFPGMKLKLLQGDLGWSAVFSDQELATTPLEASGRSPAEAICRAALAAVSRRRRPGSS